MFDEVIAAAKPQPPNVKINPTEDLALIIYTGGTTGVPKGAAIPHIGFVHNVMAVIKWMQFPHISGGPSEPVRTDGFHCFLGVLPWYHSFGMSLVMLSSCATASRLVCVPDPRAGNPPFTEVLKAVEKYRTTMMIAVPTIFVAFTTIHCWISMI